LAPAASFVPAAYSGMMMSAASMRLLSPTLLAALCGLAAAGELRGANMSSAVQAFGMATPAHPEPATDLAQDVYGVVYGVRNVNSGKYLNVIAGSREEKATVQLWDNLDSAHSQWRLSKLSAYGRVSIRGGLPGVYLLQNINSELYLSVANGSAEDGANVRQQKDWADLSAQWLVQRVDQGIYGLQNVATGKWLNVMGGDTTDGANIWQWNSVLQNHSWWTLEKPQCKAESAECDPASERVGWLPECCLEGMSSKRMACQFSKQTGWGFCRDTSK